MNNPALSAYGRIIRARWRWVAWAVMLAAAALTAMLVAWPPQYRTQATVFVQTPGDVSQVIDGGDLYAQARAETYAALARSTGIGSRVIADLGLSTTPERFASRVHARHIGKTALFQVSVDAPTPQQARRSAEVLLAELSAQVDSLEAVPGDLIPRAQLVVVDQPGSPRRILVGGIPLYGVVIAVLLVAAALGATAAVIREVVTGPHEPDREDA